MKKRRIAKLYWLRFLRANERVGKRRASVELERLGWDIETLRKSNHLED